MKNKNLGNIKIVSLLFILGVSSASLAIPAVIQKDAIQKEIGSVKGNSDSSSIIKKAEDFKYDYVDKPIEKVVETTKNVTTYIQNPEKIIYKETNAYQSNPTESLLTQTSNSNALGTNVKNETNPQKNLNTSSPEPVIKITKEMVENCRLITTEYNKVIK